MARVEYRAMIVACAMVARHYDGENGVGKERCHRLSLNIQDENHRKRR